MPTTYRFFFQAEDGIRDDLVTGVQRVLFRSLQRRVGEGDDGIPPEPGEQEPLRRVLEAREEIGRASCRERVDIWVGAGVLKRKVSKIGEEYARLEQHYRDAERVQVRWQLDGT